MWEQAAPQRWKAAVGISVVAHLLVGAALFLGLQQKRTPQPVSLSTAMAVEVLPMPSAPAVPPHETPPAPDQPKPASVEKVKKLDLPPIPDIPNAAVTLRPKEPPPPALPQPVPPPAAQAAPAKATAAPIQGTPTQGITNAEQNYDAQIVAKLERKKRYPSEAMARHMEDVVYVHIVIDRSGRIVSSEIVRSKHFELLDGAVRDLIQRANPLPQMPKALPGDTYAVVVPIDFFINHAR